MEQGNDERLPFEPSVLIEHGELADVTENNQLHVIGNSDGPSYS